ncbi:RWD-domain-containing protein [Mytilinidion resinicola]|uniref:RWD-domain-containing protein n=1 Tax=Mytilinidion resinicola TaxID=574789 RepID=A0A6A6YA10_9PEZI|nr:RWD-domain-containing protein [Mytilinidion resinicola]KAF2804955.1 RWD-domain-containing protein [Mytilinidion resinicola]
MGIEEQKEEREVLDSIFPEEITDISETEYRISILLDVTNEDGDDSEPPTLLLRIQYPPTYPDSAPLLDISAPPNAPKHKFLDISSDRATLLAALTPTIEENLGMAMVFTLYSSLKDSAELLIAERQAAAQALRDVEAAEAEEAENAKFHGTQVTRESFLKWREGFRREMREREERRAEEKEAEDKKKRVKEEKRMTGRELWEGGLAKGGEEEEEGGDGLEGVEKLKIEA